MKKNPPSELGNLFCHFIINERKLDSTEFEPGTLTSFQRSFVRHLRELHKPYSILTDKEFSKSREANVFVNWVNQQSLQRSRSHEASWHEWENHTELYSDWKYDQSCLDIISGAVLGSAVPLLPKRRRLVIESQDED